ncbi:prepilin peptidase-dependent protein [Budvicia diplopodorum]|uniref:prepilin peptidase-dependent protein n=1 Tax=Budvicia diplopodorum TaxID=1119056 RepID=UPI0013584FE7|nr:prepilin peptidase-dependent protein [Budvicia diplopodorum]
MLNYARLNNGLNHGDSQRGFSLLEMLIAMVLSSVMMVSVAAMYPALQHQSQSLYRLYRLEQSLRQVLRAIEKDIKRAGFYYSSVDRGGAQVGNNSGTKGIRIGAHPQSANSSCVLVEYDLNHNGAIEPAGSDNAEQFGYRWLADSMEQHRGPTDCSGVGWDKLLDPAEVVVTQFLVTRTDVGNQHYFTLTLEGYWNKWPQLKRRVSGRISAKNLT